VKGSFYRRDCECEKEAKGCTCGAKWVFTIDVGPNPVTGKRPEGLSGKG